MNKKTARKVFKAVFGVAPDDLQAQDLIDQKLLNNDYVIWRAIAGNDPDGYTQMIAELWTAIYVLGLRQCPVMRVS